MSKLTDEEKEDITARNKEATRVYEPKPGETITKVFILPPDIELNPFLMKILIYFEIQILIIVFAVAFHVWGIESPFR